MKQAIIITAYKQLSFLNEIINVFDENYVFYIHLDNKKNYDQKQIDTLHSNSKIKCLSFKYGVNWGSVTHLEAILHLYSEALKDQTIEYIHLITGQDYPIKSPKQISEFLEQNRGLEFIEGHSLPSPQWKDGGLNRIQYYLPYESFNARNLSGRIAIKTGLFFQKLFRIKRSIPSQFETIYGGTVYSTLSRHAIEYLITTLQRQPELLNRFKKTFCAEEILIHTLLMDTSSPFRDCIAQDNKRFIIWERRNGKVPANLDETDFEAISHSEAFFARKFEFPISSALLKRIRSHT